MQKLKITINFNFFEIIKQMLIKIAAENSYIFSDNSFLNQEKSYFSVTFMKINI